MQGRFFDKNNKRKHAETNKDERIDPTKLSEQLDQLSYEGKYLEAAWLAIKLVEYYTKKQNKKAVLDSYYTLCSELRYYFDENDADIDILQSVYAAALHVEEELQLKKDKLEHEKTLTGIECSLSKKCSDEKEASILSKPGFLAPKECEQHKTPKRHCESIARVQAVRDIFDIHFKHLAVNLSTDTISEAEVTRILADVHDKNYLNDITRKCKQAGKDCKNLDSDGKKDNFVSEGTLTALYASTKGSLAMFNAMMSGIITTGFLAIRPPGHHARTESYNGFCFINNIYVLAQLFLSRGKKVKIIDIDAHHADGTTEMILRNQDKNKQNIFLIDLFSETSFVKPDPKLKASHIHHIELKEETDGKKYLTSLKTALSRTDSFDEDITLVSAGFDGASKDFAVGGLRLQNDDFAKITDAIVKHAKRNGKSGLVLFVLEGGYNPASVAEAFQAVFKTLLRCSFKHTKHYKPLTECFEEIKQWVEKNSNNSEHVVKFNRKTLARNKA